MTTGTDPRFELADRAREALMPLEGWAKNCHGASLALVKAGTFAPARVARGFCQGVGSQHSWVVLGDDCYDDEATIVDPTLWSYDPTVKGVWIGGYRAGRHRPHGKGSIWSYGRPAPAAGPAVTLTPRRPFSEPAQDFLDLLGPLDRQGWGVLAHAPVEDWPAAEIIDAIYNTNGLGVLVPIDIVGMLTDRNPDGVYLAEREEQR